MNYIKELNAFRDWLLINDDITTSEVALWHSLMTVNNMTGWKTTFSVPNSTLQSLTGLSKQGLDNARNKLKTKGFIEYQKGQRKKSGKYKIISLVNSVDQTLDRVVDQPIDQTLVQPVDEGLDITKQKQNENKKSSSSADAYNFFQENFGVLRPFIAESLGHWIDEMSEDLLIESMKIALKAGKGFDYAEGILRKWDQNGISSLRDVEAEQATFSRGRNKKSAAKQKSKEDFDLS